jgi:hypothetical protein
MLKKRLVKLFGNIDELANRTYFEYSKTPISKNNLKYDKELSGFKFVQGSDNIFYPFDGIDFTSGNNINIIGDQLQITYSSTIPSSIGLLDSTTGELVLYSNSNKFYNFTVTFNGTIKAEGQIYIGYREPVVGDYAYADGTFSPSYIDNKTLVGIIYAKRVNPSDGTKLDLAILSNKTIKGVMSPDFYTYNSNQFDRETEWG